VSALHRLLWALIGLMLTVGGTFIEAFVTPWPWAWDGSRPPIASLGVSCQVGAVLLVGCAGGAQAGAWSQMAYLGLGLAGIPVFAHGGGLGYVTEPTFGYLLGFVPGAWLCGRVARKDKPPLERLAAGALVGLAAIHACGVAYLLGSYGLTAADGDRLPLGAALSQYSLELLPGQLAVACAAVALAFGLRQLLFY